ncbi:DgyrCDS13427 [Dimorphilus gyrociliatus]|nr:DgyrCDS13427 [Dimorphilus gyrociliatus]
MMRLNDAMSSISAGIISQLPLLFGRSIEVVVFCYVHKHYKIAELNWNSPITWWIGFLGVDLGYYCLHRAGHEINLFWAAHQVHHSSQDYNLSTALRQSIFQRYCSWMFYAPLALFLPPQVYMVHVQFNLLYQYWIHTELIDTLGPLEWIMNTPSHHRVHHGRNPYCIDKNYAGTLIIWDRLFGTFQAEEREVSYGLVHPLQTWNPFNVQLCHFKWIWLRFNQEKTILDKLSTIFKGPGWHKGTPRLGKHEELPEVEYPVKLYDNHLPYWYNIYVFAHFLILIVAYTELVQFKTIMTSYQITLAILFILYSLTTFGALNDKKIYGCYMESVRLLIFMALYFYFDPEKKFPSKHYFYNGIKVFSTFSFCLFTLIANRQYTTGINYCHEITQKTKKLL